MKKTIAVVMAVVMLIGMVGILAGCGDKAPAEDNAGKLTVAVVVAGKFGDRSFYDSSKEGLDRLVADHGVNPVTIECNNENHDIQMKTPPSSSKRTRIPAAPVFLGRLQESFVTRNT